MTTTATTAVSDRIDEIQRICSVNELFLLRKLTGKTPEETCHATLIPFSHATCPTKANPSLALGVEPSPFFFSILHPRTCSGLRLCCASIGPMYTFRPDIIRAALRVFVSRSCKASAWTAALTWFWKLMEESKGRKTARGKQWIDTGGIDFWSSMRNTMEKALHDTETLAADLRLARTVLLHWTDDLLRRHRFPSPHLRHVLHTGGILDPGTLLPTFDANSDDSGLRLLCGIEPAVDEEERLLLQCYSRLFDDTGPLLQESRDSNEQNAWTRLVDLRIAKRYDLSDRTFYFSPYRILPELNEAFCRPPSTVIDAGILDERPLDQLARLLIFPIQDYFVVYDSTVTADSRLRRLLLAQFRIPAQDLAVVTNEAEDVATKKPTMTRRIRLVKSRVYRVQTEAKSIVAPCAKTVFLLDFANWRLQQLQRLRSCFPTSRMMSSAHAAWVALNIATPLVSVESLDPTEWTRDTPIKAVVEWFEANFIDK